MELFIDTETSGVTNSDWTVQLGWILRSLKDSETEACILAEGNFIIKANNRSIHPEALKVHNITPLMAENGFTESDLIKWFLFSVEKASVVIAHNYAFDARFISALIERGNSKWEADKFLAIPSVCTMRTSTDLCGLKNIKGAKKAPKLTELYEHLFGADLVQQHGALSDALATMHCYDALKIQGIIK